VAPKDSNIRTDVLAEMAWDPKVTVADSIAGVNNGYVTLTGAASTYATKYAATAAAFRVYGVKDATNDVIVDPAAFGQCSDQQIEADVRSMRST
jgi:osmotically-inducible protein OsmY